MGRGGVTVPILTTIWEHVPDLRRTRSSSKSSRFLFEFESNEMFEFEFEVRVFSTFSMLFRAKLLINN